MKWLAECRRLRAVLSVMRSVFGDEIGAVAADAFARLAAFMDRPETRATVLSIMNYLLQSARQLSDDDFLIAVKPLEEPGADTMSTLIDRWKEEGRLEGREEGREAGRLEGRREGLLAVLAIRFETVPESVREAVQQMPDAERLGELMTLAMKCPSIEAFRERLDGSA